MISLPTVDTPAANTLPESESLSMSTQESSPRFGTFSSSLVISGFSSRVPPQTGISAISTGQPRVDFTMPRERQSPLLASTSNRPEDIQQRDQSHVRSRNVDSNVEQIHIIQQDDYNSFSSHSSGENHSSVTTPRKSRVQTDSGSPEPPQLTDTGIGTLSIIDPSSLSPAATLTDRVSHSLTSKLEKSQKSPSPIQSLGNVTASETTTKPRLSDSDRLSSLPESANTSHDVQTLSTPVQAEEQQTNVKFESTVAETTTDTPTAFHPVIGHPESFRTRRTEHTQDSLNFEREPDYQIVQLASKCLHANDYTRMIDVLSSAPVTVSTSFGNGLAFYKLRQMEPALKHFSKMEDLAYQDRRQVGSVYLSFYYRGEICLAKQTFLEAALLFHKSVNTYSTHSVAKWYRITPPSLSVLYAKEGASFRHAQRILEAVKAYKNAISCAETRRDKLSACTSLGNMYQSLGENALALQQYETTVKLATDLQDFVSLGWAHGNMGNAYLGLQQKDKALHHLKEALELAVKYETTPQAIGRTYNNLGTAYQSMSDLDKAEEYYDLALSQAIYGNDVGGQARVYGNFGNVLMLKKDFDRAIVHYTEAYNLSTDRSTKTTALHNRGCACYEKGETTKKNYLIDKCDDPFKVTFDGANMEACADQRPRLPEYILRSYRSGHSDLAKVIERHEESFQAIKGSTHGLTLSVSLFESNSRTFHRVQDCLYNLGEFKKALEFAEQSRTRSLGELMFERTGKYQDDPLSSPIKIEEIYKIIKSLKSEKVDVVYISYTGARIIVWVISPINNHVEINMFQAGLRDDQFEGKSLDYFLRYSLSELLIENHIELYSFCEYETANESKLLSSLYDIFGKPLLTILEAVRGQRSIYDVILITDSYTYLMPVMTLYDSLSHQFLGDRLRVRYMPSLLTMGIMTKMPEVIVEVSEESRKFCVVGNPTIPMFTYQGETWRLGKLPFATKEAEWVAHILKTTPTLHEQATKMIILSMINSAKVVHLATHGSANAGFLAFAGLGSSRTREVTDEKTILLYPEDVEKLHISPALVVLSSCDSGRGTVKADGIQGMARAFILAGAQSVLTTLWRIHDESAATFMKFFYQYLMDGFRSSVALHKASLSLRCFAKYSHYVHWSGYQLTGREIQLDVHMSSKDRAVLNKVGVTPTFPRLEVVKKLEAAFLKDPATPTDVQLIHGFHGLKPSEPVIDFVKKHHTHFTGGVFFVCGAAPEFIQAAEMKITKALSGVFPLQLPLKSTPHILLIFDNLSSLPPSEFLQALMRNTNTHIIVTLNSTEIPKDFVKSIDRELLRGTNTINLKPLSSLHSAQRLVHTIMKSCDTDDFIPYNKEQKMLSLISDQTGGCPDIIDITSTVCAERLSQGDTNSRREVLKEFCKNIERQDSDSSFGDAEQEEKEEENLAAPAMAVGVSETTGVLKGEDRKHVSSTGLKFTRNLLKYTDLPQSDHFLLTSLHWFGPIPIPRELIDILQSMITSANKVHAPSSKTPLDNLLSLKLLQVYPSTVIVEPMSSAKSFTSSSTPSSSSSDSDTSSLSYVRDADFYYVPQLVADALKHDLEPMDSDFSLATTLTALQHFAKENHDLTHTTGLANILSEKPDEQIICFQEIYRLYLSLIARTKELNILS